MAIRLDYLARETSANLVRNLSITFASVVTVFVSLTLVGTSLMAQQGIDRATKRWQGGIEFIVFMNPTATEDQLHAMDAELKGNPNIERTSFVDQTQAYAEFQELFRDSPEMVEAVEPKMLPTSFRVEPKDKSAETIAALSEKYRDQAGVKQVVSAIETIRMIQRFSSFLTLVISTVAVALLAAAVLLTSTTTPMAM